MSFRLYGKRMRRIALSRYCHKVLRIRRMVFIRLSPLPRYFGDFWKMQQGII